MELNRTRRSCGSVGRTAGAPAHSMLCEHEKELLLQSLKPRPLPLPEKMSRYTDYKNFGQGDELDPLIKAIACISYVNLP